MPGSINIDSKGYGKIYKAVMRNRKLPLLAKAIYAYLCAYAGSGCQAYPKRDKIVRDMQINKDTYTKHLGLLVSGGYISKERTASGNTYTIMQTVPGYELPRPANEETTDMLIAENVRAQGFGAVPKLVMLDARLTAQAKAIYAYFASYAGAGTSAFPRRSTIIRDLNMSLSTYYEHFNLLLDTGYISVEYRKSGGRFDVSLYRLADIVKTASSHRSLPHKGKPKAMSKKPAHGEKRDLTSNSKDKGASPPPMSEKSEHGEMPKKDTATSENPMSEKPISEKLICGKPGHAKIKNNSTTNNLSEKEQVYYHQGCAPEDKKPVLSFSPEQVKKIMGYENLRLEALAWVELKAMLGHFTGPDDKSAYMRKASRILNEVARQARIILNASQEPQRIIAVLESEVLTAFYDDVMDRYAEIRTVNGYVRTALKNMLK